MPKKIDPELRSRAVRLVTEHRGQYPSLTAAAAAVAKQLNVGQESVRRWVIQANVDAGGRDGIISQELDEIRELKARSGNWARTYRSDERRQLSSWGTRPP